jgi:hypothetical protein
VSLILTAPIGTPHPVARCLWCAAPLQIGKVWQLRCWLCPRHAQRQAAYSLKTRVNAQAARDLGLGPKAGTYCHHVPLPSQVPLYEAAREGGYVLWGGRAGPGKSTGLRWLTYYRSLHVPGHVSLLLRENWDQLKANHTIKMAQEVPKLGGRWLDGDRMAVFGTGSDQSIIYCGHMADMDAVGRYLGIEYGLIGPDEASLYPVDGEGVSVLAELSTRARLDYVDRDGAPVKGLFLPTTNPGGPSAAWLKDLFIDHAPDFDQFPALRPVVDAHGKQVSGYRPEQWRYVQASLADNPYMREDYAQTNLAVLSETRYKQLAEGDWNVFAGMFFGEWQSSVHLAACQWAP